MRVASLDFSDASTSCPSGLQERARVDSGIRTCRIESSGAACPSVMLSTSGVEYTKVCGKILAYQLILVLLVGFVLVVMTLMVTMLMESA